MFYGTEWPLYVDVPLISIHSFIHSICYCTYFGILDPCDIQFNFIYFTNWPIISLHDTSEPSPVPFSYITGTVMLNNTGIEEMALVTSMQVWPKSHLHAFSISESYYYIYKNALLHYFQVNKMDACQPSKLKTLVLCLQNILPHICEMLLKMFINIKTFGLKIIIITFLIIFVL